MSLAGQEGVTGLGTIVPLLVVLQVAHAAPDHSRRVIRHVARRPPINVRAHVRCPAHAELRGYHRRLYLHFKVKVRLKDVAGVLHCRLFVAQRTIVAINRSLALPHAASPLHPSIAAVVNEAGRHARPTTDHIHVSLRVDAVTVVLLAVVAHGRCRELVAVVGYAVHARVALLRDGLSCTPPRLPVQLFVPRPPAAGLVAISQVQCLHIPDTQTGRPIHITARIAERVFDIG